MSSSKSTSTLGDQQFMLKPDEHAGIEAVSEAVDMDIVAATYRSIVDQDAFEEMIENWQEKLSRASNEADGSPSISRQLIGQLIVARNTLEKLDIPAENDPLKRAISDVPGPAVVLSPEGRVAIANTEGEYAFGARQGAFFNTDIIDPFSTQDYASLKRAANARGNAAQTILTITPDGKNPDYKTSFLAEGYLVTVPGHTGAYIAIRSLDIAWSNRTSERLQQAFGLSQAEADVSRAFFQHRNIEKIADERGVSLLTVRTQVKSIMAKTGAQSNIDLMRLLAMVASRELIGQRGQSPVWRDPLEREQKIKTADGRVVAWTWMGAEDGIPVVLLRGLPMTYLLPGEGEEKLRRAGIKLHVLSRPGYGNSTLDTSSNVLDDNVAALRIFLDQVISGPCLGVGMASGILPLLKESQANPKRFHSLLSIGFAAIFDITGVQRLPKIQRTMLRLAPSAPWVVELMAKAGHRMIRQNGVDWYLERAYASRTLDMQTFKDPDRSALIRNACEHVLKQGHTTFVRELQLVMEPAKGVVEDLKIPLRYLLPTEDVIFSETANAKLMKRNPLITVEPVPDAGELLFYQQTDLMLKRIIDGARNL